MINVGGDDVTRLTFCAETCAHPTAGSTAIAGTPLSTIAPEPVMDPPNRLMNKNEALY
jgi:hypothetical protein